MSTNNMKLLNFRKYDEVLTQMNPGISVEEIERSHEQNFANWLKQYVSRTSSQKTSIMM